MVSEIKYFLAKIDLRSSPCMCQPFGNPLRLRFTDNSGHNTFLPWHHDLRHPTSQENSFFSREKIHSRDHFQRHQFFLLSKKQLDFYCHYSRYNCIKEIINKEGQCFI